MTAFTHWARLALILVMLAGAMPPNAHAQTIPPTRTPVTPEPGLPYFYENNHNIEEPFASFYTAQGGAARLGLPITDKFAHPQTGVIVQYFQRARLEFHPNDLMQPVKFSPIGLELLGRQEAPVPVAQLSRDSTCVNFPTTGHQTCLAFGTYYKANKLDTRLGAAISKMRVEGGRLVQYFENGRLDFYPEKPAAERVQLADLGLPHFEATGMDRQRLAPVPPTTYSGEIPITTLRARAQVRHGFIGPGNKQRITVRVVDQLSRPVFNATVNVTLRPSATTNPGSASLNYSVLTDNTGTVTLEVPVGTNLRTGSMVSVEVSVISGNQTASTVTSYIIWGWNSAP